MGNQQQEIGALPRGKFFRFLSASTLFTFCGILIQATVSTYFASYMTDTVMIPAGTASIIMLIACLWDAINDPMMGAIVDRHTTRWGKFRPYILVGGPLLTAVTFFLFRTPLGMSENGRVWYIAVFYILYGMVITLYTIPTSSVTISCIGDMKQRNKVFMFSGIGAGVAFTIASSFSTDIAGWFGGESWCWNMLLYGIPMCLFGIWYYRESQERFITKHEKQPVIASLKMVLRHKPVWVCIVIWVMASLGYGLMFTSSVYYIKYCIATEFSQWALIGTYMLVVSLGALVSMVVFQPIMMKIFKYKANSVMLCSQAVTAVLYVVLLFVGRSVSFPVLCALSFLATCFTAMEQALVSPYIADAVDYVQLKEGAMLGGIVSSIKGFAYKMGTTAVNYGILALLAATGYVENTLIGMGQSQAAVEAINICRFGIPAVCCLVMVICCAFYPMKKYYAEFAQMRSKMTQDSQK